MTGRAELDAAKWILAFLSPYRADPPLPVGQKQWARVFEVADRGLVLPRLALEVHARAKTVPSDVSDYLNAALELNRLRNGLLRDQLLALLRQMNSEGVVPVVMKGATTLLDGEQDLGARMMLDIDIWTPDSGDHETAARCLRDLGYEMRGTPEAFAGCQHMPPFFLEGALSRIELHHRMVSPNYAALIDETAAAATLIERHSRGVSYRLLDPKLALSLSCIQCRWACDMGHVTMMKWLDLLDRCHRLGIEQISSPRDLHMRSEGDQTDARLLTALAQLCGLPYTGPTDPTLVATWEQSYRQSVATRFARNVIGNAFDPKRWSNKSLRDVWTAVSFRVRNVPSSYRRARKKDVC